MKFKGKITNFTLTEGVSKKGDAYIVRKWRIEEEGGQYPNSVMVESFNKDFGNINEGDVVEVDMNSRCDIVDGRMYNKLSAWKMTVISGMPASAGAAAETFTGPTPTWATDPDPVGEEGPTPF